jgi:hypothetical protein
MSKQKEKNKPDKTTISDVLNGDSHTASLTLYFASCITDGVPVCESLIFYHRSSVLEVRVDMIWFQLVLLWLRKHIILHRMDLSILTALLPD